MEPNGIDIQNTRIHSRVVVLITVACIGAIIESISQGWEVWVPPLIIAGIIASWSIHFSQYGTDSFRENFYLIFSMVVAFYHGVHRTSFFDVIVISALMMATATLLKRADFLRLIVLEYLIIIAAQLAWNLRTGVSSYNSLEVSRVILHVMGELCIYEALKEVIKRVNRSDEELRAREEGEETERTDTEDFLVNISHELRTPVNVINGMSTLILKKDDREDVRSIRDAGIRLSCQIEDIQDYSEIQRGDVVLEEDKYMITSILNDILVGMGKRDRKNDLDVIIDLDPDVPSVLNGDAGKLSKILRHLMDNALKFTRRGGIYIRISSIKREYGVNLIIEVTDTGIGMTARDIEKISMGHYQADRRRNRSNGGIGLGLSIVYGFVRKMNGFVSIESKKGKGTTVRISIAQEVVDPSPCLGVDTDRFVNIAFHVVLDKFKVPELGEFYKKMASNMASGLRMNLYAAPSLEELKKMLERGNITHVFMGEEEYAAAPSFFDNLATKDVVVAVSASPEFKVSRGSDVIVMPKPLYGYPVVRILSGEHEALGLTPGEDDRRPELEGVRALVVDDEPMNLVVASGLFRDYKMIIDTAESGREAIDKFENNDYDVVFMDHMMPEMDGVEAMRRIRTVAAQEGKPARVIALTANAISGAREMFMREGFDGFISKPIDIREFERTIMKVLPGHVRRQKGGRS